MEFPLFIICMISLVWIYSVTKDALRKNIKSFKISFSFLKGFNVECTFHDDSTVDNNQE